MISSGTLIIGKDMSYYQTFSAFPEREVGIILKYLPPDKHDIQGMYHIFFLDGTCCEYENFVITYYEIIDMQHE